MTFPLCVDLDGTVIYNDVTLIAYGDFIYGKQLRMLQVLYWLIKGGRALVKQNLARYVDINPRVLNYNETFVRYLRERKEAGGTVYLATACNEKYALEVSRYLGIFDGVFASNSNVNLRARAKAKRLIQEFGDRQFAYAGNSRDDLEVWKHAGEIIVVNPSYGVLGNLHDKDYLLFD